MQHSGMLWLLLPAIGMSLLAAVQLRFGSIKSTAGKAALYFFVVVICVVTLYPYYVMTITAFRSNAETLDMYFLHLFPTKWIWSNLSDIIHRGVPRYLLNSLLVAGGATVLAMLCGIPAAYAMARMNFKGKKAFLGFVIMSQMFSPVVLLIGISQLMNTLHLNDSVFGLMLINAAFNQAFAIWLLRGTFVSISPEMEQAALIDGCGTVSDHRNSAHLHVRKPSHHRGHHAVFQLQHDRVAVPFCRLPRGDHPGGASLHEHRKAPDLRPYFRRRQRLIPTK